jgi:hypothetical protein
MQIQALTEAQGWLQTLQWQWHFTGQPILNVSTSSRSLYYLNTSCISRCDRREKKDNILEQYTGNAKIYASITVLLTKEG